MSERKQITEDMGVQEGWYKEAKEVTPENLSNFIEELTEKYSHDYGTIAHACAAAAVAGASAVNNSKQGGITGFQAGAIMWEFIRNWMIQYQDKPLRLINYEDLLYPQYRHKFNSISKETWEWIQERAEEEMQTNNGIPEIRKHWESIIAGEVPFGLKIKQ